MKDKLITFAGFPVCSDLNHLQADIAIIGAPYATPYPSEVSPPCLHAPAVIRRESNRYPDDPVAWDFDLDGTLLGDSQKQVVDCGDLTGSQSDPAGNRVRIQEAISTILTKQAVPVVLGGDDSVPIPVMRAYTGQEPFHILQLDAHIDWRDEVDGMRDGYSSTMRRASELDCVAGIVQGGMRAVGSATAEEYHAATEYGVNFVLAKTIMREGAQTLLQHIPNGERCFLTIDYDALDPAVMPAVGGRNPGGLDYQSVIDIIHGLAARARIIGVCLVELVPDADHNNLGAITAMRVAWNVIGALARN